MLILLLPANSIAQGEVQQPDDSLKIKRILDEPVSYKAQDSIRLDVVSQKVYLYGKAEVKFGDIVLKSGYIEYDFKGKNVLVVGGSRGIGKAVCEAFLDARANVYCASRSFSLSNKINFIN